MFGKGEMFWEHVDFVISAFLSLHVSGMFTGYPAWPDIRPDIRKIQISGIRPDICKYPAGYRIFKLIVSLENQVVEKSKWGALTATVENGEDPGFISILKGGGGRALFFYFRNR